MIKRNRLGQEEIIGFALIVGIVFIILLVFLAVYLRKPYERSLENYQVQSFIDSVLEYTSECQGFVKSYLSVEDLIFECYDKEQCLNGKDSCEVLGTTIDGILKESWLISEDSQYNGYAFNITSNGREVASSVKGNKTDSYLGDVDSFTRKGEDIEISLIVYTKS
ncbi:MAG TPA: hypothetical protein VJH92_00285 [Candidatus Nanoarchaeia archaeon]|nr:hypothetical protein [Candidatus Nanoarchaeia archaeon]